MWGGFTGGPYRPLVLLSSQHMLAIAGMELPVLDIAPFLEPHSGPDNDQRRRETAAHLDRFLTHFGFLYLTGYGSVVTEEQLATVLDVARSFFARPDEEKANLKIRRGDGARGPSTLCGLYAVTSPELSLSLRTKAGKRSART